MSAAVAVGLSLSAIPGSSGTTTTVSSRPSSETFGKAADSSTESKATYYDVRAGATPTQSAVLQRKAAAAGARQPTSRLRASLGSEAVVDMDGLTGTPRQLARLDGFLTRRSALPASAVAMGYVRTHATALGLTQRDIAGLRLARNYVDIAGTHHLSYVQYAGGVPLFGNGLQANVTRDGRLLSLGGSPVSGLHAASVGSVITDGRSAVSTARRDQGDAAKVGPADDARAVLFQTPTGTRRAWETITMSAEHPALTVLDSAT
ncbi:MAG TPA: hypothetical protein VH419_17670, partial [Nocardioidaceae bacterium]